MFFRVWQLTRQCNSPATSSQRLLTPKSISRKVNSPVVEGAWLKPTLFSCSFSFYMFVSNWQIRIMCYNKHKRISYCVADYSFKFILQRLKFLQKNTFSKRWKSMVFCHTPAMVFFCRQKNIPPFFLLEIRLQMDETNFTLGDSSPSGYFKSCSNSCRYGKGNPDQS